MTTAPLVLDAGGLEALSATRPPHHVRALLAVASRRGRDGIAPTVAGVKDVRDGARTRALEAAAARHRRARSRYPALRLIDTDFALARQVGAILGATASDSSRLVDAHVVAVCVPAGGGLVVTSDADDITTLAAAVLAVRIRVTRPDR